MSSTMVWSWWGDVNTMEPLDRRDVIKTRMQGIKFFNGTGVDRKVPRSEVQARGGEIISAKWVAAL